MLRRGLAVLIVVGLVAAVGASVGASATHRQWVANANAACAWANTQTKKLGPNTGTTAQWLIVFPKITVIQTEELRRIRAVAPPKADKLLVDGLVSYWTKDIAEEHQAYLLLKAKKMAAFNAALTKIYSYERSEDVLLRALGTKCRQV